MQLHEDQEPDWGATGADSTFRLGYSYYAMQLPSYVGSCLISSDDRRFLLRRVTTFD
jgi:hypothetical protein